MYIGVFTYCLAYKPYFHPVRIANVNKKVSCQPGCSYFFEVARPKPNCEQNCAASVVYPQQLKDLGSSAPESHGACTGCRGKCVCKEDWHGSACEMAECPADNCYGQGTCEKGKCKCKDTVSRGLYCERRLSANCPMNCYGNGNCPRRLESYSSNITVATCECISKYRGHLCNILPKVALTEVTPLLRQWISLGMVGLFSLMFVAYAMYNQMLNSAFEYSQIRRVTSAWDDDAGDDVLDDSDEDEPAKGSVGKHQDDEFGDAEGVELEMLQLT
jgi:hypothetical protein